jgi:hypothetical protein
MRARVKIAAALAAVVVVAGGVQWSLDRPEPVSTVAAAAIEGDSGDDQATTSFDGPMVRQRAAIGIHPAKNADLAHLRAEMQALATAKGSVGKLTEATFAVFSEDLLTYLVPEVSFVLPEGVPVSRADAFMRDHQPADVAFYVVQPVLVHDLTFAVVPAAGQTPAQVRAAQDSEGILADSLNHYVTTVQPAGVTVSYFGAVLSDETIGSVRDAMARAAKVTPDRIQVSANEPGPGVDLSNGLPDLAELPHTHH